MDFIIDSNTTSSNNNIINGISDNIVYNSFLISNIIITSNYSSNISNVLKTNIDNNLTNNSNFTSGTGFNTSNYASNISNILLNLINTNSGSSNYSLNISNILKTNIDANNTTTNTAIGNTSNYAFNISNILLTNINTNYLQKTGGNITGNTNINGIVNINNGTGYAITNGLMQSGTLTIGGTNINYGGNFYTAGNWNGNNTAGLLMECLNNTEIAIHDVNNRLASLMYYEGADNKITLGRNMGWGTISTVIINGNTGIGTINPSCKLHIEHSSTSLNTSNGGLYVYNPNNTATSSSVIGTRIGGTSANKAGISLDVLNNYGWSIYITGNDTIDKCLRFNSSCDTTGLDRLKIRGSDGYTNINGGCRISNDLTVDGTINATSILINNLNISNSIINNNTYTSNISNVLQTNINTTNNNLATNYYNKTDIDTNITNNSNYASNISNVLVNLVTTNSGAGSSNYASNISNILLNLINTSSGTGSSNYTTNVSNILQTNINTINNNYLPKTGGTISGLLTTNSNIDCGGGIAINGANAFYYQNTGVSDTTVNAIDLANTYNTYINFKEAGSINDWCYLRQIGGNNTYKLSFDFLDDNNDARFCIRSVNSANSIALDTIKEVFTVDNGNITCTGKLTLNGELVNGNWKMTNDSDFCRLYNNAGTSYFNFAAQQLYANTSLTVLTTASIGGTCTAATFSGSGASLTNIPFSALTGTSPYVLKAGDTMTGTLNTTSVISSTLTTTNNTNAGTPSIGASGGSGDRLIIYSGSPTTYPYSLGINNGILWYSVPINAYHKFYVGGTLISTISSTGLSFNNLVSNRVISLYDAATPNDFQFVGLGAYNGLVLNTFGTGDSFQFKVGTSTTSSSELMRLSGTGNLAVGTTDTSTYKLNANGSLNATTIYRNGTEIDTRYLQLTGGTITGQLQFTKTDGNNPIYIYSTIAEANNCIQFKNNGLSQSFVGTGGTNISGANYKNNFFIETTNALILNVNRGSASTPNFIINNSGNVGIGTTNPIYSLHIRAANPSLLRIETSADLADEVSGIEFGIPAYTTATSAKITSKSALGFNTNLQFATSAGENLSSIKMTILGNGNVGIGTTNPSTKLHIEHSSTTFNAANGGLFVFNPNNLANNVSVLGARINGSVANKAGISLDVFNGYGWSIYINGNDTTDRYLRFNNTWDGAGTELLQIRGSDGYTFINGGCTIGGNLSFGSRTQDNLIYLYGTDYGIGVNPYVLRYNSWLSGSHKFYSGSNNTATISSNGIITATTFSGSGASLTNIPFTALTGTSPYVLKAGDTMTGDLTLNKTNPNIQIGGTNGNNWAVAGGAGYFSTSAANGDMVLRSIQKLHLQTGGAATAMTINTANNIGIGTTDSVANLNIYDTTQLKARLILSGQEFYTAGNTSTEGIAFLIGVNRTDNRQLWIGESSKLTQNTTNAIIRLMPNGSAPAIDAVATNGLTALPLNISGSVINLNNNTVITGSLSATTINRNGVEIDARYLQLSGGTMTGTLQISTPTGNTGLFIYSSVTNSINNIELKNNANNSCYIGIGGNGYTGNYINNLFIQSPNSLILNINGNGTSSTPNFIINNYGSIGIGTATPNRNFEVFGPSPALVIRAADETQTSTLFLGTGYNNNGAYKCAIIAQGYSGWSRSKLHFCLNNNGAFNDYPTYNATTADAKMTILPSGYVGIGNTNAFATLCIGTSVYAEGVSDGTLVISKNTAPTVNRSFKFGYDADYNFCMGDCLGNGSYIWRSSDFNINYLNGNIGIGTVNKPFKLYVNGGNTGACIEHTSTTFNTSNGGLFVFNPNNSSGNCSVIGTRISGTTANKAGISLEVLSTYGWSIYINGNDTVDKCLRFNSSSDGIGTERLQIRGSDGYMSINGGCSILNDLTTTGKIYVNSGIISISAADSSSGGTRGIIFRSNYDIPNNNNYNCSILTYDHDANGTCDGLSINGWDGISFCTGSNLRLERMRINLSGYVGIGTTNIYNNLDVYGSNCTMAIRATHENQTATLYYGTSHLSSNVYKTAIIAEGIANNSRAKLHLCLNDDANNTTNASIANARMTILSNGNIGIGTNNPLQKLHIDGGLYLTGNPSNPGNNSSASFWNQANVGPTISGYAISFQTNGTTERMIITNNGNVGIGTNTEYSTATKLNIKGSSSGYSQPLVRIEQTAGWDGNYCLQTVGYSDLGGIRINGGDLGNSIFKTAATGDMGLTVNNGNMLFNVNSAERMRINPSGYIGIGTNNPANILQVGDGGKLRIANGITDYSLLGSKDTDGATNTRIVVSGNTRGSGYSGCIEYVSTSTGSHIFYSSDNTNYTERMRIANSGNVGIGTATPSSLLHIKGIDTITALTIMGKGGGGAISQLNLSTYDTTTYLPNCSLVATDTGNYGATFEIKQKTSGANANAQFTSLFINKDGNVGLGTTNPSCRLQLKTEAVVKQICLYEGSINNYNFIGFGNGGGMILQINSITYDSFIFNVANAETNATGNNELMRLTGSGQLQLKKPDGNNSLYIQSSLSGANNCIKFQNNNSSTAYVGLCGTVYNNYSDNFIIETTNSIILNSGRASTTTPNFIIKNTGTIGILTTSPLFPLHVYGSAAGTYSSRSRLSWNGNTSNVITLDTSTTDSIGIKSESSIWTAGYLIYSSDIRIKNNIIDIDDDMALQKILLIQPKIYNYIDISRGSDKVYGFIAQQIKEVIPEAITITKETIPNIFKTCECNNDEITLENDIILSNLNINDKIDVIDMENQRKQYTITDILDNKIKLNENLISSNCFIYGKEVNDFHTLDKTYIFTLNVCATQELYKLIQEQKNQIIDLQNQINALKQYLI